VPQETLAASTAPFLDELDRLLGAGTGRWLALFVAGRLTSRRHLPSASMS
jgi:hypothetical protein